jgi:hypothetical protein
MFGWTRASPRGSHVANFRWAHRGGPSLLELTAVYVRADDPETEMMSMSTEASWPPPSCPPLEWPESLAGPRRYEWYASVIEAFALLWKGHVMEARVAPVPEEEIVSLERRLGASLPQSLRTYHLRLGALELAETLCSVAPSKNAIQTLDEAFPSFREVGVDPSVARDMIAFGDSHGSGNLFCFERRSGEVFFFDHDDGPPLTRFFADPDDYLEALMIKCLADVHEDEDAGEELLVSRLGRDLVRKWMY